MYNITNTNITKLNLLDMYLPAYHCLLYIPLSLVNDKYTKSTADEYYLAGSRYSGKTDQVFIMQIVTGVICAKQGKKFVSYNIRKMNNRASDLYDEFVNCLSMLNIDIDDLKITKPNGRIVVFFSKHVKFIFMGIYQSHNKDKIIPLKGLPSTNKADLCIRFIDENSEISNKETQAITMAIRGAKRYVEIGNTNPDNPYFDYIKKCSSIMEFDKQTMIDKGMQFFFGKHKLKKVIALYTNYQVNHHLRQHELENILKLKYQDPVLSDSWVYGIPASLENNVFDRHMRDIWVSENIDDYNRFYFGVDLATADTAAAHSSKVSFIAWSNKKQKFHKFSKWSYNPSVDKYLSPNQQARSICEWMNNTIINFQLYRKANKFVVNVDYGCGGLTFIDTLNSVKLDYQYGYSIEYAAVNKEIWKVIERVNGFIFFFTTGRLTFESNLKLTNDEYPLIQWNTNTTTNKIEIIHQNDNEFDSDYYAIAIDMRKVIKYYGGKITTERIFGK